MKCDEEPTMRCDEEPTMRCDEGSIVRSRRPSLRTVRRQRPRTPGERPGPAPARARRWRLALRGLSPLALRLGAALALGVAFGALAACRSLDGPSPARAAAAGSVGLGLVAAPESAHGRPDPYAGQRDAVLAGGKLFARHCAGCHGRDGRGGRRGPPLDSAPVREAPPGDLFWFVTNGNLARGMPAWSRLPEAQRWQLVTFLKAQAAAGAAEPSSSRAASAAGPRKQ
jgi:mono/diheme cytochrome c family protein